MSDFEVWVYRIMISVLGIILWWGIQQLIRKFNEVIRSINELITDGKTQQEQIKGIVNTELDHSKRLNDHAARLRSLELDHARCFKINS